MSKSPSIPPLPFRQVKSAFYVSPAGAIVPVNCLVDAEAFKEAVEAAILTAGNVESCRREVQPLLSEPLDLFMRWYILDALARHRARFLLYSTRAEAEQSREERERKAVSA